MSVTKTELEEILLNSFADAELDIKDNNGSGDSYQILVKSDLFIGLSRVKQHRMVMDSLADILKARLHAVSVKTAVK